MNTRIGCALLGALGIAGCADAGGDRTDAETLVVLAAASLGPAVEEIAADFERRHGVTVQRSYAASSTLAKQIDAGAPADVYVSANPRWMDWLAERGRVDPRQRFELASNSLVIVAPAGRGFAFDPDAGRSLGEAFRGRLALGDPDHVPAGEYAREALARAGWWEALAPRIVPASDARAALAFVERGECGAGIVYASDAASSRRVEVVARVPESWHAPIVYPAAVVAGAGKSAADFVAALRVAAEVFERHGFRVPAAAHP